MTAEELIWILFILFLVLSNITSYKMGHVRGLMQGITTFELFEARRKLSDALYDEMRDGNPAAADGFEGLHPQDFLTQHPLHPVQEE